jgi:chromosome segregation ATPase
MCIIADLREQLSSAEKERDTLDSECSDLQHERDELQNNYDKALASLAEIAETASDSDSACD